MVPGVQDILNTYRCIGNRLKFDFRDTFKGEPTLGPYILEIWFLCAGWHSEAKVLDRMVLSPSSL